MPKFGVYMIDAESEEILATEEETFDNLEDAEDYAQQCNNDFAAGEEVLELAGEDFIPSSSVDFVAFEIDE